MNWRASLSVVFIVMGVDGVAAELRPETVQAWNDYVALTEARIDAELASDAGFRVMDFMDSGERAECQERVRSGEVCVLKRETLDGEGKSIPVPDGMIHHWYGAIFVPDVTVDQVLAFVQNYDDSADYYPEVESSRLVSQRGDVFDIFLRLKRKKILTVLYNTSHEVTYEMYSEGRASSRSLATKINEISHPGEPNESEKPLGDDRGFLWGLSSYWRFDPSPDGTLVECESISLSRSVPAAARWLVRSYIDSVPRESLESTLEPIREFSATR